MCVKMRKTNYNEYMPSQELENEVSKHLRWQAVLTFIGDAKSVLDIGAGSGHLGFLLKEKMPHIKYLGVDIRPENVAYMQNRGLNAQQGISENLSQFADKSFDVVVLAEVLEHLPNPGKAYTEAFRIGKKVITTVPQRNLDEWHLWDINWVQTESHQIMVWDTILD